MLEELGVRYMVGGSVASGILGEPRSTIDVDFVVEFTQKDVSQFLDRLGVDYYFDLNTALAAVAAKRSFNVIHLPSALKVDFFVVSQSEDDQARLRRHLLAAIDASGTRLRVHAPEDLIVWKLRWYREGGEMSERQWRDALGILKIQRNDLDLALLSSEAARWGVEDLLDMALTQAGMKAGG